MVGGHGRVPGSGNESCIVIRGVSSLRSMSQRVLDKGTAWEKTGRATIRAAKMLTGSSGMPAGTRARWEGQEMTGEGAGGRFISGPSG